MFPAIFRSEVASELIIKVPLTIRSEIMTVVTSTYTVTPAGMVTVCPAVGAAGDQIKGEDQLPETLEVACPLLKNGNRNTSRIDKTRFLKEFNMCVSRLYKIIFSVHVGFCKYTVHSETLAGQGFQKVHGLFNIAI